jgi:hypothetical protein
MRSATRFCAALTFAAAGLLLVPAANAQDQSSPPPATAPGKTTSPANISDKKLDAAAAAVKSVSAVSDNYRNRIAKAPAGEKDRLVGEANDAIRKAVTDQGLSVEEYTSIINVAQNDPAVRDKLLKRLQ